MITITSLIITLYILPIFYSRWWIGKAYSKQGIWNNLTPGTLDVFLTLFPIINLVLCLVLVFEPNTEKPKKIRNSSRFFNIKK